MKFTEVARLLWMWFLFHLCSLRDVSGIILCIHPTNERQRYIVTSAGIGWAHTPRLLYHNCNAVDYGLLSFFDFQRNPHQRLRNSLMYHVWKWSQWSKLLVLLITHWGRVTHICVSELTIIGSDNGLSPGRRQAIIWTNAGILLIQPLGTNFNEI